MKIFSKKIAKVIIIVIIFGIIAYVNPKNFFTPFHSALMNVTSPFQKTFRMVSLRVSDMGSFLFSIGSLKEESKKYMIENAKLKAEIAELHNQARENEFLRNQLDLLPKEYEFVPSPVIGVDVHNQGAWMEISKGSKHGIQNGMPIVISKNILVGRVHEVFQNHSKILLYTNSKNRVNAMIAGTGTKGIVRGEYGLSLIFDSVLDSDPLSVGDEVITSGLGNEFPKGLFIGTVQEIHPTMDKLFKQAIVSSPINVSKLEFVFVMKERKQDEEN